VAVLEVCGFNDWLLAMVDSVARETLERVGDDNRKKVLDECVEDARRSLRLADNGWKCLFPGAGRLARSVALLRVRDHWSRLYTAMTGKGDIRVVWSGWNVALFPRARHARKRIGRGVFRTGRTADSASAADGGLGFCRGRDYAGGSLP
jgi:hypothetical protein